MLGSRVNDAVLAGVFFGLSTVLTWAFIAAASLGWSAGAVSLQLTVVFGVF